MRISTTTFSQAKNIRLGVSFSKKINER